MSAVLMIPDDMVAVRLIHEDGYQGSGIDAPFFINEKHDPSVCRDAIVVAAPKMLRSAVIYTSSPSMVPDGADIEMHPTGRNGEWAYTMLTPNNGLLEAGDRIRITATRDKDCTMFNGVATIGWDTILWVEKPGARIPLMNGVMVKRVERDSHIIMDSGANFEPCIGVVVCSGIPRSSIQIQLNAGDGVMFKSRKGAVSNHDWNGVPVEYVPYQLITGVLS